MNNIPKETILSWDKIEYLVEVLCLKIKQSGSGFDQIATVSRGGLVPARLVADVFDIKKILVDQKRIPADALFVDDIYDSGDTFKKVYPRFTSKQFLYATLVARKGKPYPKQLIYAQTTLGDEYVVFPWDRLEYKRKQKAGF